MSKVEDHGGLEPFQREERFIVIKRKHLIPEVEEMLRAFLRRQRVDTVECVVVESDWPEYETVWRMIEDRVTGSVSPATTPLSASTDAAAVGIKYDDAAQDAVMRLLETGKATVNADGYLVAHPPVADAAVAGEGRGTASEWAEKRRELMRWAGSAFLAGEPVENEDADRAELYSFLCGLIGWFMAAEDAAALSRPAPAEPVGLREALEPFARQHIHKNEAGGAGILVPATVADVRRAKEVLAALTATTADAASAGEVAITREMFDFLCGAGPLEGYYFGDKHEAERGAWWWRKRLHAMAEAPQPAGQAMQMAVEALRPFAMRGKSVPDSYKTAFVGADDLRRAAEAYAALTSAEGEG